MADFDAIYEDPSADPSLGADGDGGSGSAVGAPLAPIGQEPVVIRGAGNITV